MRLFVSPLSFIIIIFLFIFFFIIPFSAVMLLLLWNSDGGDGDKEEVNKAESCAILGLDRLVAVAPRCVAALFWR